MAADVKDLGENIGNALGKIAREAAHSVSSNGHGSPLSKSNGAGSLSGMRGVAAGAALAAAPFAAKSAGKLVMSKVSNALPSGGPGDAVKGVGKKLGEGAKSSLPGGGGGDEEKSKKGTPGVGKGRRMPVQQAVDVAVPISTAYNQWTQFEEWPQFMHRLDQATQEDDCNVSFKTKIWGMSREFEAQIVEQRPDERIRWTVSKGVTHNGVVTFHELADRLTRVQVTLDVEPGSLLEKAARGMRHVKRAVRADLSRFQAFIEMQEAETGAWRGVIHDGEVVEKHDPKYDKQRDYADFDDIHETEESSSPKPKRRSSSRSRSKGAKTSRSRSGGTKQKPKRKSSTSARSRGSSSSGRSRSSSSRSRSSNSPSSGRSRSGSRSKSRSGSRSQS